MFDLLKRVKKRNEYPVIRDRPLRSLIKTVSWRVIGTIDTFFISYLITGKAAIALGIGSVEIVTKMFLYFVHERVWAAVRWGRMMVHMRKGVRRTKRILNYFF